jgi:hypothetical protein
MSTDPAVPTYPITEYGADFARPIVKALPELGGIDATAAATQKLGDVRTRFDGLDVQLARAFQRYDEAVKVLKEHGIEAHFTLSPAMKAAYHAWRQTSPGVKNVSPAPIPPVSE